MFFKVNNKIILFIHIPKCGGTTIEENLNALQPKKITLEHQKLNLEMLWGKHKNFQLQHLTFAQIFNDYKYAHNKSINDIDFIFTIVRNPIDRIISEANWQISHQYFQYRFSWERIIQGFSNKSPQRFCHFLNQKEFISDYEEHINIYSLDNLKKLRKDLNQKIGIDLNIEKSFSNKSKKVFDMNNITDEVKEKIIQCSLIDKNYFCENKNKFTNITEGFYERLS